MGLYESLVLTFGLTNAPGTFQSVMNEVLGDVIGKFVLVYLDDLVIFSKTAEEHVEHVRIVLGLLRKHRLYAKLAKCTFMQSELKFLGQIVGAQGLQVDPKKVAIVQDWPVPTGVALLRSFLGLANYFRKFVQGWSALVAPLQRLTKKDKEFVWSAECDQAFEGVKEALTHAPVLALPDLNNRFEVICDACGVGLGAVLVQGGRPIAFEGKRMSEAEQKYTTGEKELLAVVHALELWLCYLDGVEFTVVTDHSPNTFFHTQAVLSPRQARWAEKLSRFSFQWEYRAGRNNVADPLSRHPNIIAHMVMCAVSEDASGADLMDVDGSGRVAAILAGYATDAWFADASNVTRAGLRLEKGAYWKGIALVVPDLPAVKAEVLQELHDSNYAGHVGIHRTIHNVKRIYWWPGMAEDIKEYVKGCDVCQRNKGLQRAPAGKLMPLPIPTGSWDTVTIDRITHLPKTAEGHTSIFVAVDKLTKMVRLAAGHDTDDAEATATLFRDTVFRSHGMPFTVVSDRGTEFTNKFAAALFKALGTDHCKSTSFHPQSNGQTERMNRVLEDMLRHFVNPRQDDWDTLLPVLEFAINNSLQESIQDTPFYLNYGRHPRVPSDVRLPESNPSAHGYLDNVDQAMRKARKCLEAAQQRQKHYADEHRTQLEFGLNDEVLLSTEHIPLRSVGTRKLLMKWMGPFKVVQRVKDVAYELELPEPWKIHNIFHVSLLKPYHKSGRHQPPPPALLVEGEEEFEVEEILSHEPRAKTKSDNKVKFLVKWRGFGHENNTWEPFKNMKNAPDSLKEYWDRVAVQAAQPSKGTGRGVAPTGRGRMAPVSRRLRSSR